MLPKERYRTYFIASSQLASALRLNIPEKVRAGYIGQIQPPAHAVKLVELDQHEIDIRIHHRGELHDIVALLHIVD